MADGGVLIAWASNSFAMRSQRLMRPFSAQSVCLRTRVRERYTRRQESLNDSFKRFVGDMVYRITSP